MADYQSTHTGAEIDAAVTAVANKIDKIDQDLSASGFTPVANTYYKHTGTTTTDYTNGVVYFYNGSEYKAIDGSGSGSAGVSSFGGKTGAITLETGLEMSGNKLKLIDEWADYLEEHTYAFPVATLAVNSGSSGGSYEYGTAISATFKHNETNISNINGTLALYKNSSSVKSSIDKSSTAVAIDYTLSETLTSSISIKLKGVDTKGNEFSSGTISYTPYKPVFYGGNVSATISAETGLAKKLSASFGTVIFTTTSGQYGYFVTAGTISSIKSGGFDVPFTRQSGTINVTLNGQTVAYNVYRTESALQAGSNTFVIS